MVQFVISIAQSDLILPLWSSILNNHVCICRVCMIPLSFIFLPTWEQLWLIMYKYCPRKWCWAPACACWLAEVQAKIGRGIVMTRPNQFVVGQNNIFSGGNPAKLPSASPSPRNPFQAVTENSIFKMWKDTFQTFYLPGNSQKMLTFWLLQIINDPNTMQEYLKTSKCQSK